MTTDDSNPYDVCGDPKCPVRVTHYRGEHPDCSAHHTVEAQLIAAHAKITALDAQITSAREALDCGNQTSLLEGIHGYIKAYESCVDEKAQIEESRDRLSAECEELRQSEARAVEFCVGLSMSDPEKHPIKLKEACDKIASLKAVIATLQTELTRSNERLERQKSARKADRERTNETINSLVSERDSLHDDRVSFTAKIAYRNQLLRRILDAEQFGENIRNEITEALK